jgi:8-oxo-dGTP diphosphatase
VRELRDRIRAEFAQVVPFDAQEEEHRRDALSWVDSGVELCRLHKPATPSKHLITYFAVVDDVHVLLVDHINAQLWLPCGGHVEPGEHPRDTVRREVVEELGIEAEFMFDAPVFVTVAETVGLTAGHTDVSLWYVLNGNRNAAYAYDREEFKNVKWFSFGGLPVNRVDPHLRRFVTKLCCISNI